jgi:HK97 family phage prohead protease
LSAITEDRASVAELERRRRMASMLKKSREQRSAVTSGSLELRESDDGKTLTLVGLACRTDVEYDLGRFRELVQWSALTRTLSENPDVQFVVNHAAGGQLPLGRTISGTLRLSHVPEGLAVEVDLDSEDPDAQSLVRKMRRGDVDAMSFAFMVTDDVWNDDFSLRTIRGLSLHRGDVSVVNQGANPHAYATVRSAEAATHLAARSQTEIFDALYELRIGKALSAVNVDILTDALNLAHDAETAAGDARALLDGLINPDTEDEAGDSVERSIENEKDLCAAIRAVVREPDKDERRAEIITRARALDRGGLIPDAWSEDGASEVTFSRAHGVEQEQRETYGDTLTALDGALHEKLVTDGECWYVWVQDFTDTDVIYYASGDLYKAPYTLTPGGPVEIGDGVKVRPVTEYVERSTAEAPAPVVVPDFTTRAAQEYELLMLREGRR